MISSLLVEGGGAGQWKLFFREKHTETQCEQGRYSWLSRCKMHSPKLASHKTQVPCSSHGTTSLQFSTVAYVIGLLAQPVLRRESMWRGGGVQKQCSVHLACTPGFAEDHTPGVSDVGGTNQLCLLIALGQVILNLLRSIYISSVG